MIKTKSQILSMTAILMGGLLMSSVSFSGNSDGAKTIKDGVYTEAQAQEGKKVFDQFCNACHVKEFYQAKLMSWKGAPLIELYDSMSATMPEDNAGGLMLQEYTDVMAYILSLLEHPAGDKPLDHNDGSMSSIIID
ncbi:MAG: hypothetical protein ACRBCS_09090 [Cellvibrionaceae bacterium]